MCRVAAAVTRRRSHRSGRARFGHPVRQPAVLLGGRDTSAEAGRPPLTLSSKVAVTGNRATRTRPVSPGWIHRPHLPSHPQGPRGRVPLLPRYYEDVRPPTLLPPRFVAFAWQYHGDALVSLRRPRARDLQPGVGKPVPPAPARIRGSRRVSQVPGEPAVSMPCSQTPADQRTRPLQHVDTAPVQGTTKAHTRGNFGAQSHGFDTGCLRFVRCLTTRDARLASGRWPSSTGWDWLPTGFLRKVSDHSSSSPKLSWRKPCPPFLPKANRRTSSRSPASRSSDRNAS